MSMTKPLPIRLYELLRSEFEHSSKNLRAFARSRKYTDLKYHYRIYKDKHGELHFGFIDDFMFCGRKLIRLASGDKQTFAYRIDSPVDVTEWFISEYKEKGMCAYAGDWRHEFGEGWDSDGEDGSTRTCKHCNKTETLHSKMVRKTWWQ